MTTPEPLPRLELITAAPEMLLELQKHWLDGECYCLSKAEGGRGDICAHCTTGHLLKTKLGWLSAEMFPPERPIEPKSVLPQSELDWMNATDSERIAILQTEVDRLKGELHKRSAKNLVNAVNRICFDCGHSKTEDGCPHCIVLSLNKWLDEQILEDEGAQINARDSGDWNRYFGETIENIRKSNMKVVQHLDGEIAKLKGDNRESLDSITRLQTELAEARKDKERLRALIKMTDIEANNGKWSVTLEYNNYQDVAMVLNGNGKIIGFCGETDTDPDEQFILAIDAAMKATPK